jgi:hypothetical protein
MKKYFIVLILVSILGFTVRVHAQDIEVELDSFVKNANTNFILLNLKIDNPNNIDIAYWRVRGYCEDKINLFANGIYHNDCAKTIRIEDTDSDSLIFLGNNIENNNALNLKIRAYDKEDNRIYNQKELFLW